MIKSDLSTNCLETELSTRSSGVKDSNGSDCRNKLGNVTYSSSVHKFCSAPKLGNLAAGKFECFQVEINRLLMSSDVKPKAVGFTGYQMIICARISLAGVPNFGIQSIDDGKTNEPERDLKSKLFDQKENWKKWN